MLVEHNVHEIPNDDSLPSGDEIIDGLGRVK
jgi:hypothetical protein